MKIFSLLFLLWSSILFPFSAEATCTNKDPLSVVIIGAGPAGLASAIEAKQAGTNVTLIEKRSGYSRVQTVLLFDDALQLLKGWQVACPQMKINYLDDELEVGIVRLKDLEESLAERAQEMGIKILHGEFKGFKTKQLAALIDSDDQEMTLPYDILVGADGMHSRVRNSLGIQMHTYGKAVGIAALVSLQTPIEMSIDTTLWQNLFLRRIKAPPSFSVVFAQSDSRISPQQFAQALYDSDWIEEAHKIRDENTKFLITDIEIQLQQAQHFSDPSKSIILVGDAAATASFFDGMGANTAFQTTAHAGQFIRDIQVCKENAYIFFNQKMKETTDELINISRYLFKH